MQAAKGRPAVAAVLEKAKAAPCGSGAVEADDEAAAESGSEGSESEEYEIADIADRRVKDGQLQYLVVWAGYERGADDTWEPASSLPKEIVADFESSLSGEIQVGAADEDLLSDEDEEAAPAAAPASSSAAAARGSKRGVAQVAPPAVSNKRPALFAAQQPTVHPPKATRPPPRERDTTAPLPKRKKKN